MDGWPTAEEQEEMLQADIEHAAEQRRNARCPHHPEEPGIYPFGLCEYCYDNYLEAKS